jgi:SAM-dependent methyltransferase
VKPDGCGCKGLSPQSEFVHHRLQRAVALAIVNEYQAGTSRGQHLFDEPVFEKQQVHARRDGSTPQLERELVPSWPRPSRYMASRSIVFVIVAAVALGISGYFLYRAFVARRVFQETDRLAQVLALGPTSHVADVGAGDGAYSLELASRIVPTGRVFATEIEAEAVEALGAKAAAAGLQNITALRAREDSTNLPANCCDAIFLRSVYHHITRPAETTASLRDALRPDGRLAIIDFEPSWFLSRFFPVHDAPADRGGHGVAPALAVRELEQAGFRLIERVQDWAGGQYCLVFRKSAVAPAL